MSIPSFNEIIEQNDQTEARLEHLQAMRELVGNVYPNKFTRSAVSGVEDTITNILHFPPIVGIASEMKEIVAKLAERERPPADIKDALNARLREFGNVRISGRLTTPPRGNFVHLTDGINKLQIYCDKKGGAALVINDGSDTLDAENGWAAWQLLDHGDFVGVEGYLFITNTGELSVHIEKLQFLAKAMLPMPDKMHGIADPELQRRFRYADLIASSLKAEPPALAGGTAVMGMESGDNDDASTTASMPPAYAGGSALSTREVFERRAKLISGMRRFLDDAGFIEVETPMLTPKATGAAAKPFETHHHALGIPLYARVAPELYLKRLVVGGFEKVYELNRNFRNEGLSQRHNPEFTMLEFYIAYMDVNGMMDFAEKFLRDAVKNAFGKHTVRIKAGQLRSLYFGQKNVEPVFVDITVGHVSRSTPEPLRSINSIVVGKEPINVYNNEISFEKFHRITMKEAVIQHSSLAHSLIGEDVREWLDKGANVHSLSEFLWWVDNELSNEIMLMDGNGEIVGQLPDDQVNQIIENSWTSIIDKNKESILTAKEIAMGLIDLFEDFVEERLIQPTFITDYPKIISPLSKADPSNPNIAERFELFINGMEVANGFSELNDPKEQYERFVDQMSERERGDEEAMVLDEDYIRALSYGMPPAAGIGIGIDRLVMLLTNKHSIRDVILFPHMRPERNSATEDTESTEES